jgi:hypothetical protein
MAFVSPLAGVVALIGQMLAAFAIVMGVLASPPETGRVIDEATNEIFRACGLAPDFAFVTSLDPVTLGGDFDGDDSLDQAAMVQRNDGRRALFICRAGTWHHYLALDEAVGEVGPDTLATVDYWSLHPVDAAAPVGLDPPPALTGDGIILGIEGASSAMVYWDGAGFASYGLGD